MKRFKIFSGLDRFGSRWWVLTGGSLERGSAYFFSFEDAIKAMDFQIKGDRWQPERIPTTLHITTGMLA